MRPGLAVRLLAAALILVLAVDLNLRLADAEEAAAEYHSLYLPSGASLRHASLGYRVLLADVIYVWSLQYYSHLRRDRWRNLTEMYDVITELDSQFLSAYVIGALILALEAGRTDQALRLLDRGIEAMPGTYVLAMEAAMYARDAGDYAAADDYLAVAESRPDAPSLVARWRAALRDDAGDTAGSLGLWIEAMNSATAPYERGIAARHVHDLTIRLHLERLGELIAAFRERAGRCPRSLGELVKVGFLTQIPRTPEGEGFVYDQATCEARSPTSFLLRHSLGRHRQRTGRP